MTQYLILGLVEYPEAGDVDDQIVLGHIIIIISQVSDPLQASLQELGNVEAEGEIHPAFSLVHYGIRAPYNRSFPCMEANYPYAI